MYILKIPSYVVVPNDLLEIKLRKLVSVYLEDDCIALSHLSCFILTRVKWRKVFKCRTCIG